MEGTNLLLLKTDIYAIVKIGLILFLSVYSVIAAVAIKQISLMAKTIKSKTNKYLFLLAYIHFTAVVITLIFAAVAL